MQEFIAIFRSKTGPTVEFYTKEALPGLNVPLDLELATSFATVTAARKGWDFLHVLELPDPIVQP